MTARQMALSLLVRIESAGQYSNLALDGMLKRNDLGESDKALLTVLVYGVIEKKITLDYYIDSLSSKEPEGIEPEVRNILRLGLYQLIFLDRIPPHAAINESVELCPRRAKGFVNALLREYTRHGSDILLPKKEDGFLRYLSVRYSFPIPLCERIVRAYGEKDAEAIFSAFGNIPGITLRTNTLKVSREQLLEILSESGIDATPCENAEYGIRLLCAPGEKLRNIGKGLFFVQDEASQICTSVLGAKAGDRVIDVCACPGSKSFGAAISMGNSGEVLSFDLHRSKLPLIEKGAAELGIGIITTREHDARAPIEELFGSADRIICDVPCSGFGVVAKKPEIRYKDLSESDRLPEIQYAILENVSRYLKNGGTLVYSTCTILPEENEEIIKKFLSANKDFSPVPFECGGIKSESGMITLTPDKHGTDGFFIAKLTKDTYGQNSKKRSALS